METYSFIELEFTEDLIAGQSVSFDYSDGVTDVLISETWQDVRYEGHIVPITPPTAIQGEATAINFVNAFNADYNVSGLFVVERIDNTVTISLTVYGLDFENVFIPITVNENRGSGTPPFDITDVVFSAGSTCSKITVSVTTSQLADEMILPIVENPTTNPIVFEYDRNVSFELKVKKGSTTKSRVIGTPAQMFSSGINLVVNDNPAGSSVQINSFGYLLDFRYSLNGSTYRNSNVFTGLIGGQYTAYIKDQYGCVTTKDFELDGFGINSPFFYIPESNSFRWANRVTFGDCGNYKNDDNTLSCEADVPLPYKEIQQFQTCDIITTQFKSNYNSNIAVYRNLDTNAGAPVPITKLTNYMRRKDKRDASLYNLADLVGQSSIGIYFLSGDTYDYDTGVVNGNYTLNGALPEWGKAGNFVQLSSGDWYLIEDVIYIEDLSAEVLVITAPLVATTDIVASFYNLQNYEIYEFKFDFGGFANKRINFEITATDPYFDEVRYKTEEINVQIRHKQTVEIKYSNDENTDMFFASGIVNKIRLPIERVDGAPIDETDTYNTDTGTILLSTDVRKSDIFTFQPITKQMMWKLIVALSHSNVQIDGVYYVKESIGVTPEEGETNLYEVEATMIRSNAAFRSIGLQFDESGLEIPGLIPTGTGYIKYQ